MIKINLKFPKHPRWLPMAALAVVLTSILAFLFVRTQGHDASSYFENVTVVRQIKQLDARWELDVMKSKMGINANYDSLVDPLSELNRLHEELRTAVSGAQGAAAAKLAATDEAFDAAIEEKTRLIEHFKSHNSVLRNSLMFLPTAAADIQKASDQAGLRRVSAAVNVALRETLVYSLTPSDEAAARIKAELDALSVSGAWLPAEMKDSLGVFTSHVRAVLREQPIVNDLLSGIAAVPTTTHIDEFDRLLGEERKKVDQQTQQDGLFLLIFATALVALLLYAAVRLIRSHAVINRVNKQLHEANAGLERRVGERTFELLAANTTLTATQSAIRNLLDNADQGFLTISSDLSVGDQSSAACEAILGEAPAGKSIISLLCRNTPQDTAAAMRATLESVFRDSDDFARELKLELLPAEFSLDGKTIKAGYKFLADSGRVMLILTDVTQTRQLAEAVEREGKRLEMTVLAFTEGEAFAALVNDYQKFLGAELPPLIQRIEIPAAASELRRHLHTYKGLLAQFSFHCSPRCLNDVETALAAQPSWTAEAAREAIKPEALRAELELDLAGVTDILGPDFASSGRRVVLSQRQLQAMEKVARATLASEEGRAVSPPLRLLLQTIAGLGMLDVKAALSLHSRGAPALADRLEKQLAPISVEGADVGLPPERYGEFFRSLVHVFRNAVDHGVEGPEERLRAGKSPDGLIHCDVREEDGWLEVLIEDDGAGVNRSALEAKLVAAGEARSKVENLSLVELVFREGLSSRDTASEISGRGVGLSAVKAELDHLDGSVEVETEQGAGTRFRFRLPIASPNSSASNVSTMKVAI